MDAIRARGIPLWVTVIAIVLGLFSTVLGITALISPSSALGYVAGADSLAISWAGRNAALGVGLLAAVYLRNANGYAVAFTGPIVRELGDMLSFLPNVGMIVGVGISFLLVDIICLVVSLRAAKRERSGRATAGIGESDTRERA